MRQRHWLHAWNAMPTARPAILSAFLRTHHAQPLVRPLQGRAHGKSAAAALCPPPSTSWREIVAARGGVEEAFDEKRRRRSIDAFLRTLPERERGIFLRRYWYVDSVVDIAARYDMKENSVKSVLFRTRERLRKHLQKEGIAV